MYDVSALKDLGIRPSYFGLGMVQLNMSPTERLNFYHPDLEVTADPLEEYHDHRYDFGSRILIGELHQTFVYFTLNNNPTHELKYVSCSKDKPAPDSVAQCIIHEYHKTIAVAGSEYRLNADVFHSVHTGGMPCLTQIFRPAKATKEFAKVIAPIGYETTCPFATDLTTDDCWDVIAKVLEHGKTQ